MAENHFSIVRD